MKTPNLPGYGLPITSRTHKCFPCALFNNNGLEVAPLLTVREYTMMEIMNRISDKVDWHTKVFDDAITAKWKDEILAQPDRDVSEKMFVESLAELKYKAGLFKATNLVEALDGGVFKSDTIIPEDLRLALIDAVKPLENVPEDQEDWHPRSDWKVLDLVHPSLYPLVYGQTRLLPLEITTSLDDWRSQYCLGEVSKVVEASGEEKEVWSEKFQWLPCDVDLSGEEPKIVSYINNLHPQKHHKLYPIIEQIIQKSMILWDQTLSAIEVNLSRAPRIELEGTGYGEATEPECNYAIPEKHRDDWSQQQEAWENSRPIIQPEPAPFKPLDTSDDDAVNLRGDFGHPDRRLQVIVKLATIHLSPASPTYDGGTWHVEGAANECICASAIYYYESANISSSLLSFRQRVRDSTLEMTYEQNDHRALETIYGFRNWDQLIQDLGKVVTRQGRLITFPNSMQHRVEPFHLDDRSQPGYRKILALFLVDPHQRVISTANVPPQQPEWWEEHLRVSGEVQAKLPQELRDAVEAELPAMVGLEEAKRLRLELMDERGAYMQERNEAFERAGEFSLCEH